MVSVDVKHHVYLLASVEFILLQCGANTPRRANMVFFFWCGTDPDKAWCGTDPDKAWCGTGPDKAWRGTGPDKAWCGTGPDKAWFGTDPDKARCGTGPDKARCGTGPDKARCGTDQDKAWCGTDPDKARCGTGPGKAWCGTDPHSVQVQHFEDFEHFQCMLGYFDQTDVSIIHVTLKGLRDLLACVCDLLACAYTRETSVYHLIRMTFQESA